MSAPSAFVIAHRGASAAYPENTESAVRHALALGVPAVECDVQLTQDDVPVVVHDADLARVGGSSQPLASLSSTEVVGHAVRLVTEEAAIRDDQSVIPTLEEWLSWIPRETLAVVELKEQGDPSRDSDLARQACKQIEARRGPAAVISFRDALVRSAARHLTREKVGPIRNRAINDEETQRILDMARGCVVLKKTILTPQLVARFHQSEIEVWSYALDEEQEIRNAQQCGVRGIISNRPDVALRVLSSHCGEKRPREEPPRGSPVEIRPRQPLPESVA